MAPEQQVRQAQETLDIYAPLAHRLGMQEIKQQLEDLSFAALHPKRYAEIDSLVALRTPEQDHYVAEVVAEVQGRLAELKIDAEVTGRGKHLWSIYEKMVLRGKEFDDIFDLVGIRVVVDSVKDCYAALGCIHGAWKPVVGRFKDYIAMPKFNLYQSLHTTVIGPGGRPLEVQIRTREMHHRAEWGVAAHWAYKEGSPSDDLAWLNRIMDWQADTNDPDQFMENLKTDLEHDEVFVFTPKGRVITLPVGSTPIDFAYAIHTEVGHACIGARVNGRLVPLDHVVQSGDTCEIFTSKVDRAGPSRDWLKIVQSPRARNKIRQWFSKERREDALEAGREELTDALRREGLPVQKILAGDALAREAAAPQLRRRRRHVPGHRRAPGLGPLDRAAHLPLPAQRRGRRGPALQRPRPLAGSGRATATSASTWRASTTSSSGCPVAARPCPATRSSASSPAAAASASTGPTAPTRSRSMSDQSARLIEVEWDGNTTGAMFRASVEVKALDRSRLLRDVSNVLSDQHVNIVACSTHTGSDRVASMRFEFEMADPNHLDAVLRTIKNIDAVYDAYRIVPGGGRN